MTSILTKEEEIRHDWGGLSDNFITTTIIFSIRMVFFCSSPPNQFKQTTTQSKQCPLFALSWDHLLLHQMWKKNCSYDEIMVKWESMMA
jgi:hypothetical protein